MLFIRKPNIFKSRDYFRLGPKLLSTINQMECFLEFFPRNRLGLGKDYTKIGHEAYVQNDTAGSS